MTEEELATKAERETAEADWEIRAVSETAAVLAIAAVREGAKEGPETAVEAQGLEIELARATGPVAVGAG